MIEPVFGFALKLGGLGIFCKFSIFGSYLENSKKEGDPMSCTSRIQGCDSCDYLYRCSDKSADQTWQQQTQLHIFKWWGNRGSSLCNESQMRFDDWNIQILTSLFFVAGFFLCYKSLELAKDEKGY